MRRYCKKHKINCIYTYEKTHSCYELYIFLYNKAMKTNCLYKYDAEKVCRCYTYIKCEFINLK